MASLTRSILYSLLVTASFALSTQNNEDEAFMTRTICRITINANVKTVTSSYQFIYQLTLPQFDDLKPAIPLPTAVPTTGNLNIVPSPYKELSWNNGFRYFNTTAAVSPPTRAYFDIASRPIGEPRISTYGSVQYFNLKSAYFACYIQGQGAIAPPTGCTLSVVGNTTAGETVTQSYEFTAGPPRQVFLPAGFANLKSVLFRRTNGLLGNIITYVGVDDIVYDVYKTC
jgi:hypothetical protein